MTENNNIKKEVTNDFIIEYKDTDILECGVYLAEIKDVSHAKLSDGTEGIHITFHLECDKDGGKDLSATFPFILNRDAKLLQLIAATSDIPTELVDGDTFDLTTLLFKKLVVNIKTGHPNTKYIVENFIVQFYKCIPDETVFGYSDEATPGEYTAQITSFKEKKSFIRATFTFQNVLGDIVTLSHVIMKNDMESAQCMNLKNALGIKNFPKKDKLLGATLIIKVDKNGIVDFKPSPQKQNTLLEGTYIAVIEKIEETKLNGCYYDDGFAPDYDEEDLEYTYITLQQKDGSFYTFRELTMREGAVSPLRQKIIHTLVSEDVSNIKYRQLENSKIVVVIDNGEISDFRRYEPAKNEQETIKGHFWYVDKKNCTCKL